MDSLWRLLEDSGPTEYGLLACSMIGNPVALMALVGAFLSDRRQWRIGIGAVSLGLGTMTVLAGAGAYLDLTYVADIVIVGGDAAQHRAAVEQFRAQAMFNVWLGLGGGVLPCLLGILAIARGAMMSDRAREPTATTV